LSECILLHETCNMSIKDNMPVTSIDAEQGLIQQGLAMLRQRLPEGWSVDLCQDRRGSMTAGGALGGTARITASDQTSSEIRIEARSGLDPRKVLLLAHGAPTSASEERAVLVMAPYLSASTQKALRNEGMNFLDFTGNIRLTLTRPGLYLEAAGAAQQPGRMDRPARSLKGAKAGRLVRVLLDQRTLLGVRPLAAAAGVDPGYVSRVLAYLADEALVERSPRGELVRVDWEKLLRRWAQESPFEKRGDQAAYIEPRGLPGLMERLKAESLRYAVTGSMAASRWAPVAPPRLLTVYTDDLEGLAKSQGLRPTSSGANVVLIRPADTCVFDGAHQLDGITYAALSQTAADLLTGPGRGPAEGEELLEWMRGNEESWRG
jgi:hypothetical protein